MDKLKAKEWEDKLRGQVVAGWSIEALIDSGKSAAVFRAKRVDQLAALKIFDDEMIARFGDKTQLARIERELSLVGKDHPNLVKIIDGGVDPTTQNHFIVMELLDGPNLKDCLKAVPSDHIGGLVEQLAAAAEFLELHGLAHRDIKPANIILLDELKVLKLLDFGVLRPVGVSGLTDGIARDFIGTLQYSSPEFLLRSESDTTLGWRAITFYQIGAVLHDLIARRSIFDEFSNPYGRLVLAIQNHVPVIHGIDVPPYLIELARCCLVKDPTLRTELVSWDRFHPPKSGVADTIKERVLRRALLESAERDAAIKGLDSNTLHAQSEEVRRSTVGYLKGAIRSIRNDAKVFPAVMVTPIPAGGLKVTFKRSAELHLPDGLCILLSVDVHDAAANVVAIDAVAFTDPEPETGRDEHKVRIFHSAFDGASVYLALEGFVYAALDSVQTARTGAVRKEGAGTWINPRAGGT